MAETENSRVTGVQGKAFIVRDGESIPAAVGAVCKPNDVLKTEEGGTLDFTVNNLAGCRILPGGESAVASSEESDMRLKLNRGRLILNIEKLPQRSTFKVETPTAVATVRGTQFSCSVDITKPDNPLASFAVREDVVDVSVLATGETFTINEGFAMDIPKDLVGARLGPRNALGNELAVLDQSSSVKTCS